MGGLTKTEQRTHFSFWCMMAAPLILGNDPRHMTKHTLQVTPQPALGSSDWAVASMNDRPQGSLLTTQAFGPYLRTCD